MSLNERLHVNMEDSTVDVGVEKVLRLSVRGYTPPTKLSDFVNDVGFITNTVDNLTNYYTSRQIDAKLAEITNQAVKIVDQLPEQGEPNILYLYKENDTIYLQYIWDVNKWHLIGNEHADLTNYYTKAEIDEKIKTVNTTVAADGQLGMIKSSVNDISEDKTKLNVKVDPKTGIASVKIATLEEIPNVKEDLVSILDTNLEILHGGDAKGN